MGSVITDASSALAGVAQPKPAAQTPVAGIAGGARAEALPAWTPHPSGVESQRGRSVAPRIEKRSSRDSWMDMSEEGHPSDVPLD
eukprot:5746929-Alexandrium_andersonii.AAC.1